MGICTHKIPLIRLQNCLCDSCVMRSWVSSPHCYSVCKSFFLPCDQFYFLKFIDSLSYPKRIITSHHLFCSFNGWSCWCFYSNSRRRAILPWNFRVSRTIHKPFFDVASSNHLTAQHKRSMWEKRVRQQQHRNNIVHVWNQIRWKTI